MSKSKYAVIGCDISYSRSPEIHNTWFKHYGINAEYEIMDVQPDALAGVMRQNLLGASVTIPYKKTILKYVDNPEGWTAVNAIKFTEDGAIATNTDALAVKGFIEKLPKKSRALLLGNGGAAAAAYWALTSVGITDISVFCRNPRREELANKPVKFFDLHQDRSDDETFDLVINALPPIADVPNWVFGSIAQAMVVDFVYSQTMPQLSAFARRNNLKLITGLDLLITQAQHAFDFWFEIFPDAKLLDPLFSEEDRVA